MNMMRPFHNLWIRAKARPYTAAAIIGGTMLSAILLPIFVIYVMPLLSVGSTAEVLLSLTVTIISYVFSSVIAGAINRCFDTSNDDKHIDKDYFEHTIQPRLYADVENIMQKSNEALKLDILNLLEARLINSSHPKDHAAPQERLSH